MATSPAEAEGGLSACETAQALAAGSISARTVVEACQKRIDATDGKVGAWAALDPDHALAQADRLDAQRKSGQPIGPLHGLPVAVKDLIDTADFPTACGLAAYAGRQPDHDATLVSRLRAAGAVIMGKTVTTEHALYQPGVTRNPHDESRTPGGSSSGSAAAVAAGMVPLAVGTQTAGSVIRPASFCGVIGFKPSFGRISREGILPISAHLDTVGTFAHSLEDTALLAEVLYGFDPQDRDTQILPKPRLSESLASKPPVRPTLAYVEQPGWDGADLDCKEGFDELLEVLGEAADRIALPQVLQSGDSVHDTIVSAELARNAAALYQRSKESLSESLREGIESGQRVLAHDYLLALDWQGLIRSGLEEVFERYDAIVTASSLGQAPGIATTGDPLFCRLWTLYGGPAVTLPLLAGADGLPIGVQLIGRYGEDGRLLRTARWLLEQCLAEA